MSNQVSTATPEPEILSDWRLWDEDSINSDPKVLERLPMRLQAAERLRAALCGVPFYAKRAAQTKAETGDEMDYWLDLKSSEATLVRP